ACRPPKSRRRQGTGLPWLFPTRRLLSSAVGPPRLRKRGARGETRPPSCCLHTRRRQRVPPHNSVRPPSLGSRRGACIDASGTCLKGGLELALLLKPLAGPSG